MAQTGFMLSDEGRTITVLNDSGTTAIVAGDLCYSATSNDVLTGTAASARTAYAGGDVKVKTISCSATGNATFLGVALEDIPADGYGNLAMEGVFIHPASADLEAGDALMANASTDNRLTKLADATTTVTTAVADNMRYKCGKALSGGSAAGKYIVWKLSL